MNISEIFIRKPIMTVLVMIAVLIFGIAAYLRLPVSDLPSVDYPVMTISVGYPGASAATMASTVATPLENECMQIPGLQSVISDNTEGATKITLTFDLNRSVDLAAPDVQAAISRAMNNLPSDLPTPPTYSKDNPSDAPIMYLMLTSETMTAGELYDYGHRTIAQRLSMISGVSQVQVWGPKTAIRVQVDPAKIASLHIGLDEVAQALKTGTVTIPAGSLNGSVGTFSIEPQGQLVKADDYKQLIVAYRDGAPVRLGEIALCLDSVDNDVARVTYGTFEKPMKTDSICIAVSRQAGANTVALAGRIKSLLAQVAVELPGSVALDIFYDKSETIVESVNDVKTTIIIALALVVLVIFVFMGRVSDTIIPGIVLPISIVGTFIMMLGMGFSLDNLSLMGITLSVGFLVDDAIVVLENTVRHVDAGMKPLAAALKSAKEITFTVISTSVALITVFVPLVFMSGVVGRNFNEFALTVVGAIICSTIMALTLTPMMCARMLKSTEDSKKTRVQAFVDAFIGGVTARYAVLLRWVLIHKFVAVILWVACIVGTGWMFAVLPKTFMPEGDSGAIMGQMVAPLGTSSKQMRVFQDGVNEAVRTDPNVSKMFSVTGMQPGADQSTGLLVVKLKDRKKRWPMPYVVKSLQMKLLGFAQGMAFIKAIPSLHLSAGGESTASGSQYSYTLTGSDRETVYECAQRVEQIMNKLPGFIGIQTSVKIDLPQLRLRILRDRASTLGVTASDIEYALCLAFAQGKVTTFNTDVDQYDVVLELDKKYQNIPRNLSEIRVRSNTGALVPLDSVAIWEETLGPQNVPHFNQMNAATLSFNLTDDVPLGNATKALKDAVRDVIPPEVTGSLQGEAQEFEEAVKSLAVLLVVAVFIMYVILGILYESYIHPFTVLTTLPVAAFGGLATLLLFRSELSLYAYIGMFMLLGIVSKNGIMMVDFAKQGMEEDGKNAFDAIYDACRIRFRPILMTGASTIMGAVPIAMGIGADGSSRRPLGFIVVGGLLFAQVITLFVTPGIFLYMQTIQERFLDRFELSRSDSARKKADA